MEIKNNSNVTTKKGAGYFSFHLAKAIEKLQWVKYFNKKSGHGFAAEDAMFIDDQLTMKKPIMVGTSNAKYGADRISNGQLIQVKFYQNAYQTLKAAFDSKTGEYLYKGQYLEVPADQAKDVIQLINQKGLSSKDLGFSKLENPSDVIKKSNYTYKQSKNIAKSFNVDSLSFDIKTNTVVCTYAMGITFVMDYFSCVSNGLKPKDAAKHSLGQALKAGTFTIFTGVITQQLLRTSFGRSIATMTLGLSRFTVNKIYSTSAGKKIIEKFASHIFKKSLHGAAAKNATSKLLRTNTITTAITSGVLLTPDVYNTVFSKKISWTQLGKNAVTTTTSVATGAGGTWAGAAIGTAILPGAGTVVGGFLGGMLGGFTGYAGSKKAVDMIADDDAVTMSKLVEKALSELYFDYLITEKEINEKVVCKIQDYSDKNINSKWLKNMYQSGYGADSMSRAQKTYAYGKLEHIFKEIANERKKVKVPKTLIKKELWKLRFLLFFNYIKNGFSKVIERYAKATRELYVRLRN